LKIGVVDLLNNFKEVNLTKSGNPVAEMDSFIEDRILDLVLD